MNIDAGETGNGNVNQQKNLGGDGGFRSGPIASSAGLIGACRSVELVDQLAKYNANEGERHTGCDGSYATDANKGSI
jgi:hypothetical protein